MNWEAIKNRCCPSESPRNEAQAEGRDEPAAVRRPGARAQGAGEPKLEDLVPIAVVIAAGCEGCAERMVRRAVEAGSAPRHVLRTIAIVGDLRERECFRASIAPEVVERMAGPLAKARQTLDELEVAGPGSRPAPSCA